MKDLELLSQTKAIIHFPSFPPHFPQTAKQHCAVRALHTFRLSTNISTLFSPEYRDYWKSLSAKREEREKEMLREREERAKGKEEARKQVR